MIAPKLISKFIIAVLMCFAFVLGAHASVEGNGDSESTLILPIQANLKVLENRLNAEIPGTLADINEPNKVCVEAKWAKTKVPYVVWEMKKIGPVKTKVPTTRTKMAKTKISPEIKCDVKGWVRRDGHISVSGSGSSLKFAFPIKAQVSAKAGIRETANAAATIYVSATPRINSDWSISVDVAPDFSWSERPNLKLFGLIKVSIGSKVEPKLREKMNEFVKKIPGILAELKLREKVASTWSDVQNAIKVNDVPEVYVLFNPESVAYSGFKVENNILKTNLSAKGKTKVIVGKPDDSIKKTELSNLGAIPYQQGEFSFSLPVFISYDEILDIANNTFPDGYVTELTKGSVRGVLTISNPGIKKSKHGKLLVSVGINYDNRSKWLKAIDVFDWFDVEGTLTFSGVPSVDTSTRVLSINELAYDSSTSSKLFDALVDVAGIKAVRDHLASQIVFAYGSKLDEGVAKANKAMNISTKDGVVVSASLQNAAINRLSVNESTLRVDTKLSGVVSASIGL